MAMKMLNDEDLNKVAGGSIVFNEDHTMLGLNCNNQAKVLDYDGVVQFVSNNYLSMSEADMLRAMVAQGLIVRV